MDVQSRTTLQPSALVTRIPRDCRSWPIVSVGKPSGSLRFGKVWRILTIAHEASVSAKSSVGLSVFLQANTPGALTPKAESWSAVKWHETPANALELARLPSFGSINLGVVTVELPTTMHMIGGPANALSLRNHDWRLAINTTTVRYHSISRGKSDIDWYLRVQSVGFGKIRCQA